MNNPNVLDSSERRQDLEDSTDTAAAFFEEYYRGLSAEDIDAALTESENPLEDLLTIHGVLKYRGRDLQPEQIGRAIAAARRGLEDSPDVTQNTMEAFIGLAIERCSENMQPEQIEAFADLLVTYHSQACWSLGYANIRSVLQTSIQGQRLAFSPQQFDRIIDKNGRNVFAHRDLLELRGSELTTEHFGRLITEMNEYYQEQAEDDYNNRSMIVKTILSIIDACPEDKLPPQIDDLLANKSLIMSHRFTNQESIGPALARRFGTKLSRRQKRLIEGRSRYLSLLKSLNRSNHHDLGQWISRLIESNWEDLSVSNAGTLRENKKLIQHIPLERIEQIIRTEDDSIPRELQWTLDDILAFHPGLSVRQFSQIFNLSRRLGQKLNPDLSQLRNDIFSAENLDAIIENEHGEVIIFLILNDGISLSEKQRRAIIEKHMPQLLSSGRGSDIIPKLEQLFTDKDIDRMIANCQHFLPLASFAERNHQRLSEEQLAKIVRKATPGSKGDKARLSNFCELLSETVIDRLINEQESGVLEMMCISDLSFFSNRQIRELLRVVRSPRVLEMLIAETAHELDADDVSELIDHSISLKEGWADASGRKRKDIYLSEYHELQQALERCLETLVNGYDGLTEQHVDQIIDGATKNTAQTLIAMHAGGRRMTPRQVSILARRFGTTLN